MNKFIEIIILLAIILRQIDETITSASNIDGDTRKIRSSNVPDEQPKIGIYKEAGLCSDEVKCGQTAKDILKRGGSIVDATIAAQLCNSVFTTHIMGIGGGFVMNYYMASERKVITINAKEQTPGNIKRELYENNPSSTRGELSISVPGEIRGYYEIHEKYGKLPWHELVEPAIKFCDEGYPLSHHIHKHPSVYEKSIIRKDENFGPFLFNQTTGEMFDVGTWIKPPIKFCNTYRMLAKNGPLDYYTGELATLILADLKDMGSIITKEDLESYRARWSNSIPYIIDNYTVWTTPPPTSGSIVGFILNILKGYNFTKDSISTIDKRILTYHRIIEAFKYGFAHRTQLTDPYFINMDELLLNLTSSSYADGIRQLIDDERTYLDPNHYGKIFPTIYDNGTAHFAIIAPNGDAITTTHTLNLYFGSMKAGKRTSFFFNNGIEDYPIPNVPNYNSQRPTKTNQITPNGRSISSFSPTIVIDNQRNEVRHILGAAGGTRIISAVTLALIRLLWLDKNIKEVIDGPRIHHQNEPMILYLEDGYSESEIRGFEHLGHNVTKEHLVSYICGVSKNSTGIYTSGDYRKRSTIEGF